MRVCAWGRVGKHQVENVGRMRSWEARTDPPGFAFFFIQARVDKARPVFSLGRRVAASTIEMVNLLGYLALRQIFIQHSAGCSISPDFVVRRVRSHTRQSGES